jgi:hypothetical protein
MPFEEQRFWNVIFNVTKTHKNRWRMAKYFLYKSQKLFLLSLRRTMRWVGHLAILEEMRYPCKIFVGKLQRKRHFGNLSIWEDNIKISFR